VFDLIIRDGLVVDGTGLPGRQADVAVSGGRIIAIGRLAGEQATRTIDAAGMVVAPGVVDVHTHYDPQVTWDPLCDTSGLHGVTTVVAGNCGFSVAPCRSEDHDYLAQVFARVEGMELSALGHVDWRFETFPQFLRALDGRLGLNLGMYVGHSA
jgi:N-acyl-D-amino-acid deacylase